VEFHTSPWRSSRPHDASLTSPARLPGVPPHLSPRTRPPGGGHSLPGSPPRGRRPLAVGRRGPVARPGNPSALLYTALSAASTHHSLQNRFSAGSAATIEHMFVETHDIDAMELRDGVAEIEKSERPVLRIVHDADRECEAQAIILRLVLTERPAELRIEAVMARIGDVEMAARAITALVEAGLLLKIDEYVLATTTAVNFNQLRNTEAQAA
jgi:hypothetical protein